MVAAKISKASFLLAANLVVYAGIITAPFYVPAAEDACILFQYSDNLARTGVVSYITNGPPVEGATAFLWMAILACARWLHIPPHIATGPLNAACLFGVAWSLAQCVRAEWRRRVLLATPIVIMFTPQIVAALSGLDVLPFCFLLALLVQAYLNDKPVVLAISALLLGLLRPDGIVFGLGFLGAELIRSRFSLWTLKRQAVYCYLPGTLYLTWRLYYFKRVFPLPFLVKSQTERWLGVIRVETLEDMSRYLSFAILTILLLGYWRVLKGSTRVIVVAGLLLPTLFYLPLRLDQNLADRFFAYLLLVPALLLLLHADRIGSWSRRSTLLSLGLWGSLIAWPYLFALVHLGTDRYLTDSLIAKKIKQSGIRGKMAVSEAGVLAYETGWPTTDMWGLNTPQFAEHLIQPDDIPRLEADFIVLRYTSCRHEPIGKVQRETRTWPNMANNILEGIDTNEYEGYVLPYSQSRLASAVERFTDGKQTYLCYFVHRSYQQRQALEQIAPLR